MVRIGEFPMNKAILVGNQNDIDDMANLLIEKYGFKEEEVQKFPTKKEDMLHLHFKGKGCQRKKRK
jgi:hypothetical protein